MAEPDLSALTGNRHFEFVRLDGSRVPYYDFIGVGAAGVVIQQGQFAVKVPKLCRRYEGDRIVEDESLPPGEGCFDMRQASITAIDREKAIYRRLEVHPGIVSCFELDSPEPLIRMAWMKNGDLRHYLAKEQPDRKTRLSWLKTMAHTLAHVHNCRVLIGDVRLDNFLLEDDMSIKLIDFSNSTLLPLGWDMQKPDKDGYSVLSDLGELGAVIYEIVTGQKCKYDLFQEWRERGDPVKLPRRDTLPSTEDLWLGSIIDACWTGSSFKSAHELAAELDKHDVIEDTVEIHDVSLEN